MPHAINAFALVAATLAAASSSPRAQTPAADPVVEWLRAQASPLRSLEPASGTADLQPLKAALQGVRVVGLGESMHGSHELFTLKHRLVQFLVTEMGFTTFTMETESSDTEALNEYVLHGTGELATALTEQGLTCWDTQEIAAMFRWLREHNRRVPDARKVHVVGLDMVFHTRGRARVLDYLRRLAPERVADTEVLFRSLAEQQDLWPWKFKSEVIAASYGQVEALHDFLVAERTRLQSGPAALELDAPIRDMRRMVQHASLFLPSSDPRRTRRSQVMGHNLVELLQDSPARKMIVWAHDSHVGVRPATEDRTLGSEARAAVGQAYYAISLQGGRGSAQIRRGAPDETLAGLEDLPLEPAPPGSLPHALAQAGGGNLFVNLRAPRTPEIEAWLDRPIGHRSVGWARKHGDYRTMTDAKVGRFDGLIFVEQSTRARPTKNAQARVARGLGF